MESIDPSYHGGGEGLLLPAVGRVPRVDQGRRVQVPARLWKPDSEFTPLSGRLLRVALSGEDERLVEVWDAHA